MSAVTRFGQKLLGDFAHVTGQRDFAEKLWAGAAVDLLRQQVHNSILHLSDPAVQKRHIAEQDYARASETPPKQLSLTVPVCGVFSNASQLSPDTQALLTQALTPLAALAKNCGVAAEGSVVKQGQDYSRKIPREETGDLVEHRYYNPPRVEMCLRR